MELQTVAEGWSFQTIDQKQAVTADYLFCVIGAFIADT